jgi:hypothetical protein
MKSKRTRTAVGLIVGAAVVAVLAVCAFEILARLNRPSRVMVLNELGVPLADVRVTFHVGEGTADYDLGPLAQGEEKTLEVRDAFDSAPVWLSYEAGGEKFACATGGAMAGRGEHMRIRIRLGSLAVDCGKGPG